MQLIAIEYFAVERLFLMADNRCADSIACDVDGGTQHIENTVDTHDKSDTLRWQSDGIQYHSQGNKAEDVYKRQLS